MVQKIIILSSEIYYFYYILDDEMKYLSNLIASKNTVFTISELKFLFNTKNAVHINLIMQRMKKQNIVKNLAYGIWTLNDYDKLEL